MAERSAEPPRFSIILPVLNEAEILEDCLSALLARPWVRTQAEIIISDGGSHDTTTAIAARFDCRVVESPAGRAAQMNAASRAASGRHLLFLHADSRLPTDFDPAKIAGDWGFFRIQLSDSGVALRVIEAFINWRTGLTRVAGGDQGLFFERGFFESLGGYPSIPLMEDVAICKLARRRAAPRILASPLISSSRRWREQGIIRTVTLMWWLRLAYWMGADPRNLHKIYYPDHR